MLLIFDSLHFYFHAGKSSLLSAILGELEPLSGEVWVSPACSGNVAYVSQQPWIQNLSVRDNILFGKEMEPEWYDKVSVKFILPRIDKKSVTELMAHPVLGILHF